VPDNINLDDLSKGKKFALAVESESPEDAQARREEKALEAAHRRLIHLCLIGLAISLVLISFLSCGYVLLTGSPNDKVWASSIVSIIVSGLCGGLFGVELGKKSS
jgi:hypothetical protein